MHLSANEAQITEKPIKKALWDWTSALLLMAAIVLASWRLGATNWIDQLFRLQFLFIVAAILGLILGYSIIRRTWVWFLALAYGSFFIAWQLGLTIRDDVDWNERLLSLWGRFWFSIRQMIEGENVEDPILFFAMMALLAWGMGTFAGFTLNRERKPWKATLPIGLMIVVLHTYDAIRGIREWYLAGFVVISLLLVARSHLLSQQEKWQSNRTILPFNKGQDVFLSASLAIVALVVLAWMAPSVASSANPVKALWENVTAPWRIFRREIGRAFYSLEAKGSSAIDYYGTALDLGRGIPVENDIVLVAEVTLETQLPARFYWRDRVYDSYQNNGWETSFENTARINAGERDQRLQTSITGEISRIRITSGRNITVLHSPANPISISRSTDIHFESFSDGTWDIGAILSPTVINAGESYSIDTVIQNVTIEELRAAGSEYPEWVLERYLQMPENISERTIQLGLDLAAEQDNPYDIADAITEWLRENIAYSNNLDFPEEDFEAVDWMLFEQREGFCNYYASAEIMLLRSLGIPARLAVGYAQGEANDRNFLLGGAEGDVGQDALEISESIYYTVRLYDAHAWPEVYFPGIGWVEFEPTVNQAALVRPLDEESLANFNLLTAPAIELEEREIPLEEEALEIELAAEEESNSFGEQSVLTRLLVATSVIVVLSLFWREYRKKGGRTVPALLEQGLNRLDIKPPERIMRWARYSKLTPLPQAFMEINTALRRIGAEPHAGDTPSERSSALTKRLPKIESRVVALNDRYERWLYNEEKANEAGLARTKWAIRWSSMWEQAKSWVSHIRNLPNAIRRGRRCNRFLQ